MGIIRLLGVLLIWCAIIPMHAHAQVHSDVTGLSVSPSVIDVEAKPRDIIKGEIKLKNTTDHMLMVFPDIHTLADKEKASLVDWVEVSRGVVELKPGEEHAVPYLIHVNYDAKPDHYHGIMWFGQGSFRFEADAHPEKAVEILVNVKVLDDALERLALATFIPDREVFATSKATFAVGLKNTGNRTVAPSGNLRIYDRRGREIATVPVNTDGKVISPDSKELLAAAWASDGAFGRYKAILDLEYGGSNKAITDTTFFWVLPWGKTLSLFTGISVAIVIIAIFFHARTQAGRRAYVVAEPDIETEEPKAYVEPKFKQEALRPVRAVSSSPPRVARRSPVKERNSEFFEKLRKREEAKQLLARDRGEVAMGTRAIHLSLAPKQEARVNHAPVRLAKYEHPREEGNVVRLSRK